MTLQIKYQGHDNCNEIHQLIGSPHVCPGGLDEGARVAIPTPDGIQYVEIGQWVSQAADGRVWLGCAVCQYPIRVSPYTDRWTHVGPFLSERHPIHDATPDLPSCHGRHAVLRTPG